MAAKQSPFELKYPGKQGIASSGKALLAMTAS